MFTFKIRFSYLFGCFLALSLSLASAMSKFGIDTFILPKNDLEVDQILKKIKDGKYPIQAICEAAVGSVVISSVYDDVICADKIAAKFVQAFIDHFKEEKVVDIRDSDGVTPLMFATSCRHKTTVLTLLNAGAYPLSSFKCGETWITALDIARDCCKDEKTIKCCCGYSKTELDGRLLEISKEILKLLEDAAKKYNPNNLSSSSSNNQ